MAGGKASKQVNERSNLAPRIAEMAAIFMIGDGLLGLLQPRRHVDLWAEDALGAERAVAPFVDHPARRRLYAIAQIAAGTMLAARLRSRR